MSIAGKRKDIRAKNDQDSELPILTESNEENEVQVFKELPKFDFFEKTETSVPYKVLLVKTAIEHPIRNEDFGVPMGLYVLKDYLNTTGHDLEVDVWDERLELQEVKDTERKNKKQNNDLFTEELIKEYDAIGISICTSEVIPALKKFKKVKDYNQKYNQNIITFCGGIFTASNEKCLLETEQIDYAIPGIATKPLGDLLVKLYKYKTEQTPKEEQIIDVFGVAHIKNKYNFKYVWTCSQLPTMQLGMWTEIIEKYKKYLNNKIGIYTSRGCDKECLFCSVQKESKQTIFRKSTECVIDEIKFLKQNGFTYFSIKDENFSLNDNAIRNILKTFKGEGIKFKIRARYDNALNLIIKEEVNLNDLKELGVVEIQYGIETFKSDVRQNVKKLYGHLDNKDKIVSFINSHIDAEIIANCSFILGLDGEGEEYYKELEGFFTEISKNTNYLKIYLNYFTPHPFNSKFSKENGVVTNDLNDFTHGYPVYCSTYRLKNHMLEMHNKIVNITKSGKYNPTLELNSGLKKSLEKGRYTEKLNLNKYIT